MKNFITPLFLIVAMAYGCLSSQNLWAQQENLSLQDAISFALAHRPELRASADWVRAAEKDRDQAGLSILILAKTPSLTGKASS